MLVEDCASACAVSEVHTGVALMGTSLPDSYIPVLKKKFKKVIVALDRDATTKAFDISNQLRYYMDTEVKILEDDLKYFDKTPIGSLVTRVVSDIEAISEVFSSGLMRLSMLPSSPRNKLKSTSNTSP